LQGGKQTITRPCRAGLSSQPRIHYGFHTSFGAGLQLDEGSAKTGLRILRTPKRSCGVMRLISLDCRA